MKIRIIWLLCLLHLPFSTLAIDKADLQGKWVITAINGQPEKPRSDLWEFRDGDWIVWLDDKPMPADPYTLNGNIIDLGYFQITVLEHQPKEMKTEQLGFVYTLKRL